MTERKAKADSGEITNRTFVEEYKNCARLCKELGKAAIVEEITPADLLAVRTELSKTLGLVTLGNTVTRMRSVFLYAFENGHIDKPVKFDGFKKPDKRVVRRQAKAGTKLFEAEAIHKLIEGADVQLRAMILLGINCGFGNSDCGQLPEVALNLAGGWIDYPRPKTGIDRRCKLWAETVKALQAALAARNSADDELVFRTSFGNPWHTDAVGCALSAECIGSPVKARRQRRAFLMRSLLSM
ncbi:MAG: hypothetical protein ABI614_26510 [Planctomycetota bacterium]